MKLKHLMIWEFNNFFFLLFKITSFQNAQVELNSKMVTSILQFFYLHDTSSDIRLNNKNNFNFCNLFTATEA